MASEPGLRKGLGRGLAALLGEDKAPDAAAAGAGASPRDLPIEQLVPNRQQPRQVFDAEALEQLTASIREKGILEPILVRRTPIASTYEIVAGERRWRAAQAARLDRVPVVVKDLTDAESLEIAIIENVQRQDLNPIEEARGYDRLLREFGHTQDQLAKGIGKSRAQIANALRLLNLPDAVQGMIADGRLTAGHARALVTTADPESLARRIVETNLTVRQAEELAAVERNMKKVLERGREGLARRAALGGAIGGGTAPAARAFAKDADTLALERDLTDKLGLKVTITPQGEAGHVTIEYKTLDQLDALCAKLTG